MLDGASTFEKCRSFGSRLHCLLRPKAGATYSEASLRMTDLTQYPTFGEELEADA
jgi:hypothetical protein